MNTVPKTECQLIKALQTGKQDAFTSLYTAYAPALLGTLLHLVGDQYLAEDLLQDAFIKIWSNIHHYDPAQGRLFTWLITITRNLAYDELRTRKVRDHAGTYIRERTSELTYLAAIEGMTNGSIFCLLAPKYRQIMELVYAGNYTKLEIAEKLHLPLGTVKTRFRTALQELQQYFSQDINQYHGAQSSVLTALKKPISLL